MKRRILIIGGPRGGKTTYARKLSQELCVKVTHFDSHIGLYDWSELSDKISDWLDEPGPWIKEGVAGVRGLRKWLRKNPGLPPFEIHVLNEPKIKLTPGQERMHKAHTKFLSECLEEIDKRQSHGGEKKA